MKLPEASCGNPPLGLRFSEGLGAWVPVAKRLPVYKDGKTYVECIVACDNGNVTAMVWTHNPTAKTDKGRQPRWEWNWRTAPWTVTHWMHLPAPPETASDAPNVRVEPGAVGDSA